MRKKQNICSVVCFDDLHNLTTLNEFVGKSGYSARELSYMLELAAQCCRALRNLSVNRELYVNNGYYSVTDFLLCSTS